MKITSSTITINLTVLKIVGIIVTIVGCFGFLYGIIEDKFVADSVLVIGMGLGSLGYRKHLITKSMLEHKELGDEKDTK